MIYRYNRALVRKKNTTDESILGLIKNQNMEMLEDGTRKNAVLASLQRDYIAGEVSKDLTKRLLLPEKIVKAHEEGVLYFHDMELFFTTNFNSSVISIGDMLDNGTVINGKLIESPKSFRVACTVLATNSCNSCVNTIRWTICRYQSLGKYVRKSYEKFKEEFWRRAFKRNIR